MEVERGEEVLTGAEDRARKVRPETVVIGGGIAGIQAALDIAAAGEKVYLVEKSGTIGGHMAMFDKTFPTLDCAACILTPKMVEVGQHTGIELLTLSEVTAVSGEPGNFTVSIERKARQVKEADCIGCGLCAEKCPKSVPSEFDAGTGFRKAAYIPFPQAVPNKYLIDRENCLYAKNGKCKLCVQACPADCIDLDQPDETVTVEVGNIIVAVGFQTFDAANAENFGYGRFDNVLNSLEFERLVNAAGPTGGTFTMATRDKRKRRVFLPESPVPERVAIIHCVGSRDCNHNEWCSRVCCMYSLKFAHLVKEKLPDCEVFEFYIDMRAFGKGYEEFYDRIRDEGVHVVRGRTATVEGSGDKLKLRTEDIVNGRLLDQELDMVILSVGLEPIAQAKQLAQLLGIPADKNNWFVEDWLDGAPTQTSNPGIHLAGACQGPKDIPDTVAQASAAAARVLQSIMEGHTWPPLGSLLTPTDVKPTSAPAQRSES
jgi:heterodisulfide reductase subunit A2